MDWKPQVGKYLVKAKYIFVDFLGHHTTISDRSEIINLICKIYLRPQKRRDVLHAFLRCMSSDDGITRIAGALHRVGRGCVVLYKTEILPSIYMKIAKALIQSRFFGLSPETIEELLTQETHH